jgi:[ribosomal protein S18]-alanine N-acetyltransferase
MDEIALHEMEMHEIPQVLEIERMSFSEPWSESAFRNEIHKTYAFNRVALRGNSVIGYICANYILDEGHILNLAVHPDFREKGIATELMSDAIHELRQKGCDYLYLEVRASNSAAKKFYERFGLGVTGIRKNYYNSPKEDALIMMGRLKEAE